MDRFIYVAMTGAKQTLQAQAIDSHNLANVSTTGFRADLAALRGAAGGRRGPRVACLRDRRRRRLGLRPRSSAVDRPARSRRRDRRRRLDRGAGAGRQRGLHARRRPARRPPRPADQRRGPAVLGDGGPLAVPPYSQHRDRRRRHDLDRAAGPGAGDGRAGRPHQARRSAGGSSSSSATTACSGCATATDAEADAGVQAGPASLETSNVNIADALVDMIELAPAVRDAVQGDADAEENGAAASQLLRVQT